MKRVVVTSGTGFIGSHSHAVAVNFAAPIATGMIDCERSESMPLIEVGSKLENSRDREALDELWQEGHEILDIYYPEEVSYGEDEWSVDIYQDEVNERCHLNWNGQL